MLFVNAIELVEKLQKQKYAWYKETIEIHMLTVVCVWKVFFEWVTQQNLLKKSKRNQVHTILANLD